MADLLLYGNTQSNVNAQPITAGQLLYTTDLTHNKQYLDKDATTRVEIGGMDLITSEVDFNAQTASTDKALDSFVLKEILDATDTGTVINDGSSNPIATTNLIDTLTGVVSNTTANQVAGALALKTLEARFTYSTTEAVVGTWIDGRPIYKKTVNFGALPNNTEKTVAHGITNLSLMINYESMSFISASNSFSPIPYVTPALFSATIRIQFNLTNITISTASDYSASTAYVTLYYVKTA